MVRERHISIELHTLLGKCYSKLFVFESFPWGPLGKGGTASLIVPAGETLVIAVKPRIASPIADGRTVVIQNRLFAAAAEPPFKDRQIQTNYGVIFNTTSTPGNTLRP